jgi:type IV pilus assembly protein PilE
MLSITGYDYCFMPVAFPLKVAAIEQAKVCCTRCNIKQVVENMRNRGFSLIELVIAICVVGILAAIALPSFTGQLRKSARAEAQSFMTTAAGNQQQYLLNRRAYASSFGDLRTTVPPDLNAKYTFTVAAADGPPPTFSMTATAIGDQARDTCPALFIDNAGNKNPPTCW